MKRKVIATCVAIIFTGSGIIVARIISDREQIFLSSDPFKELLSSLPPHPSTLLFPLTSWHAVLMPYGSHAIDHRKITMLWEAKLSSNGFPQVILRFIVIIIIITITIIIITIIIDNRQSLRIISLT